jgi:2-keto-4-pentenoate hydratase
MLVELMAVVEVVQVALELLGATIKQQVELELVELELHPLFQVQA